MKTKTKNIIIWSVVAVVAISVAILGTIFDLQISKNLADLQFTVDGYHSTNIFAIIGEIFGENILYVLLVISFGIIFFYLYKNPLFKEWLNTLLLITLFSAGLVVCFYCIHKVLEYLSIYTNIGLDKYISSTIGMISILLISCVVNIFAFFLISKISDENIKKLYVWAIVVLIVALLSNGIVQFSKRIFDRTRYRAMVFAGDKDFSYFQNWYVFNTNKFQHVSELSSDFFRSFPSGHTCAAASSFLLVCLPLFIPQTNNKKWKTIFWLFAIVYTLLVAFSRIVAGAHFFMDVYIGGLITFVITMIAYYVVYKIIQKKEQQKTLSEKASKRTAC